MNLRTLTDKKGVMLGCKRGQLYYAQLDDLKYVGSEQMKNRVVLIIQNDKVEAGYKIHCTLNLTYQQFCEDWIKIEKKLDAIQ